MDNPVRVFVMTVDLPPISPRLQERRKARESRPRPWRTPPPSLISKIFSPASPTCTRPKSILKPRRFVAPPAPTAPFPFLALPYDIQVVVCSFALGSGKVIRLKTVKPGARVKPLAERARPLLPTLLPLAQALPFLLPEISRFWYQRNTFFIGNVQDFRGFVSLIGHKNLDHIRHLQVENDFIYCSDAQVLDDASKKSHSLLTPMRNLETLTLYRDDGGPTKVATVEYDSFNSVEWFCELCEGRPSLKRIMFSLTPWKEMGEYSMAKSNMVRWIEGCEEAWDKLLLPRRGGVKYKHSWKAAIL